MLVIRKENEGVWVNHTFRGSEIRLKVRPANAAKVNEINRKHTKNELVKDPDTRAMVKVQVTDNKAIFSDMVDHFLEDFEGIGYSKTEPWSCTIENKLKVVNLATGTNDEKSIWEFVLEQSRELAVIQAEESAADEQD